MAAVLESHVKSFCIIGGGFSGALLAIKLASAQPQAKVTVVERDRRAGVGLAYGHCSDFHLLNVPVSRAETGLSPSFSEWLAGCGADLTDATEESGGVLAEAFVPRALFGRYMEARLAKALSFATGEGLTRVRGDAVRLEDGLRRAVILADGRRVEADIVILATGNMPPQRVTVPEGGAALEEDCFVPDPWAADAFDGLAEDAVVLLIGAGLTMVDIALLLNGQSQRRRFVAMSRHGWAPSRHAPGGQWARFLSGAEVGTPWQILRLIRTELAHAEKRGVPWQRVFDAARPDAAKVWRNWSVKARAQFLRHLRTRWDIHRHRMAPRIARAVDTIVDEGRLEILAGRITALVRRPDGVMVHIKRRGGGDATLGPVAKIVNCTGPRSDFAHLEIPLISDLRRKRLINPDHLRLGLETDQSALIDGDGRPSSWLYAIGPMTRPALWEVTAIPEINAQIDALVSRLNLYAGAVRPALEPLDLAFADLGAGI